MSQAKGDDLSIMIDMKDMSHIPSIDEIGAYIGLPLFQKLCQYMEDEYQAIRKIEYSKDVWERGWNVKFKKAGKLSIRIS